MIIFTAMNDLYTVSAAFTGHRNYDRRCDDLLAQRLRELHARGFRTFLCGMAVGFDMAAAEVLLSCGLPGVRLVCVVPFTGQEARFSARDKARYAALLRVADEVITLAPHYTPDCYARRNDYLVAHAAAVVAYYDGSAGGTRYTVQRAQRCGREIIRLLPDPEPCIPGL